MLRARQLVETTVDGATVARMIDIEQIRDTIPHRYPFLLVDRIIEVNEEYTRCVGIKNISANEKILQGHLPGQAIFPGALLVEAHGPGRVLLAHEQARGQGQASLLRRHRWDQVQEARGAGRPGCDHCGTRDRPARDLEDQGRISSGGRSRLQRRSHLRACGLLKFCSKPGLHKRSQACCVCAF